MEKNQRSITLQGMSTIHLAYVALAVGMIGLGIYLTHHYFTVHFPSAPLAERGLCDWNSFWTCDTAVYSPVATLLGVPTSVFGLLLGAIFLTGSLFASEKMERSNHFLAHLNSLRLLGPFYLLFRSS